MIVREFNVFEMMRPHSQCAISCRFTQKAEAVSQDSIWILEEHTLGNINGVVNIHADDTGRIFRSKWFTAMVRGNGAMTEEEDPYTSR